MKTEQLEDIAHELRREIRGEVRIDPVSRALYSTDASIYQIPPLGVVTPREVDELNVILEVAGRAGVPVVPRGSGSSLAGQTLGAALVLDCTRYLNQMEEINPETRQAIVQPGVVLNALNAAAGRQGLMFGPDPASADRANLGW